VFLNWWLFSAGLQRIQNALRESVQCYIGLHYRLLKNRAFGPDDIKVLTAAYEDALRTLRLDNRSDPTTEIVAKKIIELAQRGERDPIRLRERAIRSLSE
jgi:hypothetical protein